MSNRTIYIITVFVSLVMSSCSNYSLHEPTPKATILPTLTATNSIIPTHTATITPKIEPTKSPVISVTRSDCQQLTIDWQGASSTKPNRALPYASIPVSEVESLSHEEIAVALFCQYLERFISPKMEMELQILDYRMEISPANYSRGRNEFIYSVYFYVLPVDPTRTWWIAGAASYSGDGWIVNGSYSSIEKMEEKFIITSFFNG